MPPKRPRHKWPEDITSLLDEIGSATDRSAAIMGGSLLENFLALAIMSRFRPLDPKQRDQLFERGPLAGFYAKVNLGFALGLYESEARDDLHLIRQIRNEFAHSMTPCRFGDRRVKEYCDKLQSPTRIARDPSRADSPKRRFLDTLLHLVTGLAYEAHNELRPDPTRWLVESST